MFDPEITEWLKKRHAQRQKRITEEKQKTVNLQNARSGYASLVQHLGDKVREYVEQYNLQFTDPECKAEHGRESDGKVWVVRGNLRLTIYKNEGTMITYELLSSEPKSLPMFGCLEVAADEKGDIRYKHGDVFLDPNQAAELLLDSILCN